MRSLRQLADLVGFPFTARALKDREPETCDGAPSGEKTEDEVIVLGECAEHPGNLVLEFHPYPQKEGGMWSHCWDGWQERWALVSFGEPSREWHCIKCGKANFRPVPRLGGGASLFCMTERCGHEVFLDPTPEEAAQWRGEDCASPYGAGGDL